MKWQLIRLFLFTLPGVLFASESIAADYFVEPFVAHKYGSVKYHIDIPQTVSISSNSQITQIVAASELEYPLDVSIAGLKASVIFPFALNRELTIFANTWKNLDNPGGKMQDTDWLLNSAQTNLEKTSYTQSTSRLQWSGVDAGLELNGFSLLEKPVSYGFALDYDYSYHNMYGITGWQKSQPGAPPLPIDTLHNTLVLTYQLWNVESSLYGKLRMYQAEKISWDLMLSVSPLVVTQDKDDHVLRYKNAQTTALGYGAGAVTTLEYHFTKNFLLNAQLSVRYFRTQGKMTQYYYKDDPSTPKINENGLSIGDVSNVITLFTQQVLLSVRWYF